MLMGSILNIYNSKLLVHCSGNIFFRELIEHSVTTDSGIGNVRRL